MTITSTTVQPPEPAESWASSAITFIRKRPDLTISPLILVVLLLAWHYATKIYEIPSFILPPPVEVWDALVGGLATGFGDKAGFWYHGGVTVWESLLGFFIGSGVGVVMGFALARWRFLEAISLPYIIGFQALPKIALAPLLIIWFGFGIEGKVLISAILTFFPVLVNSMAGYRSVDPTRIDLARSCNASEWQIFCKISLPSSLPFVFAGLNVASILAMLGAIVGEFVGARSGLGMLLLQYEQSMQIAPVFAVLLVLAFIGYAMNVAIRMVERKYCFWVERAGPQAEA
ncbi:MAG: transporter permease [Rhizobacter sp.]|nr:transporter permease [Rhizobacter sp.]